MNWTTHVAKIAKRAGQNLDKIHAHSEDAVSEFTDMANLVYNDLKSTESLGSRDQKSISKVVILSVVTYRLWNSYF